MAAVPVIVRAVDRSTVVGTSSLRIAGENTHRVGLIMVNDGAYPVYVLLAPADASSLNGIPLKASGGSLVLDKNLLYKGEIRAIAVGGSSQLIATELVEHYG